MKKLLFIVSLLTVSIVNAQQASIVLTVPIDNTNPIIQQSRFIDSMAALRAAIGSGGGAVNSFNGRTGSIVPQLSDYSAYFATLSALNSKQDLLPSQTGNSGKFLTTNGSGLSWGTVTGGGGGGVVDTVKTFFSNEFDKYGAGDSVRLSKVFYDKLKDSAQHYWSLGSSGGSVTLMDNLTTTTTGAALDAHQGKVLKDLVDTKQGSLGYTAESASNKSTSTSLGTSNSLYPSQNAVKAYVDNAITSVSAGSGNVPAGGSTGQVLKKASSSNYDLVWDADNTGGGGSAYESVYVCPGLVNDGSSTAFTGTDNSSAIQTAVDYCIAHKITTLFIPQGTYYLGSPIVVRGGSSYCTLDIKGEDRRFNSGGLTQLVAGFNDAPILCLQLNKGSVISGLQFWGKFQSPSTSAADKGAYFTTPFDSWGSGARDSQHSPYCGIAIDPFTNQSGNSVSDPYPSLTGQYGLNRIGTGSGSTAVRITDCTFTGFVVGIASSVNGYTRNQEECIIEKCFFTNVKVCVSGGQDQEKNNIIRECTCWGGHTFFCTGKYGGNRMAGHWTIDHVNIAGAMIQFIDNDQHGYFPTHIRNIFCESMMRFGTLNTELTSDVTEFHADFDDPFFYVGFQPVITVSGNVNFTGCTFRYYDGKPEPLIVSGGNYYNCSFGGVPIDIHKYGAAQFFNSVEDFNDEAGELPSQLGWTKANVLTNSTTRLQYNRYGNYSLLDPYTNKTLTYNDYTTYLPLFVDQSAKALTFSYGYAPSNANPSFSFTTTDTAAFKIMRMVAVSPTTNLYDAVGYGKVSQISHDSIYVEETTLGLSNGNYYVIPLYPNEVKATFTGDIISSTQINNLTLNWGASLSDAVGMCYKTTSGVFKIISYSGGTYTVKGVLPSTQTSYQFK